MSLDPALETSGICGNCRALNPPNAQICASCGVNLEQYEAAAQRLRERLDQQKAKHVEQLTQDASQRVANEGQLARRTLKRRALVLCAAASVIVVALLVANGVYWQRLAAEYDHAVACLVAEDYRCARDGLVSLLQGSPNYPNAQENLNTARLGFARQMTRSGEWQAAVNELEAVLSVAPDHSAALESLRDVYDQWLNDALGRADLLTALQIYLQSRRWDSQNGE